MTACDKRSHDDKIFGIDAVAVVAVAATVPLAVEVFPIPVLLPVSFCATIFSTTLDKNV